MRPPKRKPKRPTAAREAAAPYGKPKPVYFLSLDVENVRCFGKKQTLKLTKEDGSPAQWTIILGDNGTGKTTLLQCLAEMEPKPFPDDVQPVLQLAPNMVATAGRHFFFFRNFRRSKETPAVFARVAVNRFLSACVPNAHQDTHCAGIRTYGHAAEAIPWSNLTSENQTPFFGYGAARRPGPASLSEPSEETNCSSLFDENADLINPQEWMVQADYRVLKEVALAETQMKRVKEALVSLLPDVTDIRVPRPRDLQDTPRAEFKTPYGWVGFNQLGFGYRSMTTWVVDFAVRLFRRYPESPNPLAEPAVCLVDEIDLHMHPRWQREMIQYLSKHFPNTQFVATAHSPLVIQAAEDANIVLLRREGDEVVIENDMNIVKGWRVDQILTSDLFGLPSARSPEYAEIQQRRVTLLSRRSLTAREMSELAELTKRLDSLPSGETPMEREAKDIIFRAAAELKRRENGGGSSSEAKASAKRTSQKRGAKVR